MTPFCHCTYFCTVFQSWCYITSQGRIHNNDNNSSDDDDDDHLVFLMRLCVYWLILSSFSYKIK